MYCKTPVTKDHTMYCKTPVTKDYTINIIRKGYAEWIHEIGLSLLEFRQSIQNLISLGYVIQTDVGQHAVNYDQLLSDLGLFYSDNKEVK